MFFIITQIEREGTRASRALQANGSNQRQQLT